MNLNNNFTIYVITLFAPNFIPIEIVHQKNKMQTKKKYFFFQRVALILVWCASRVVSSCRCYFKLKTIKL